MGRRDQEKRRGEIWREGEGDREKVRERIRVEERESERSEMIPN